MDGGEGRGHVLDLGRGDEDVRGRVEGLEGAPRALAVAEVAEEEEHLDVPVGARDLDEQRDAARLELPGPRRAVAKRRRKGRAGGGGDGRKTSRSTPG